MYIYTYIAASIERYINICTAAPPPLALCLLD